jgi:hypothetical protein
MPPTFTKKINWSALGPQESAKVREIGVNGGDRRLSPDHCLRRSEHSFRSYAQVSETPLGVPGLQTDSSVTRRSDLRGRTRMCL